MRNRKTLAPNRRKSPYEYISQLSCGQSKTIYENQLQNTLRMQPKQEATLTQPFQRDLRCSFRTESRRQSEKKFDARLEMIWRRKITGAKMEKNAVCAKLPSKLYWQLIHQHHSVSHLHSGNDPTCRTQWNSFDRACTEKTWNLTRNAEPADNDPTMSRTCRTAEVDLWLSRTLFGLEEYKMSCTCYLSKTHFVWELLQIPSATHPTAPLATPFTFAGTISLTNSFPTAHFLCHLCV